MAKKTKLEQQKAFEPQLTSLEECEAMVSYAQDQGKVIPPGVLQALDTLRSTKYRLEQQLEHGEIDSRNLEADVLSLEDLGGIHQALSETISPATPSAVVLMENTKKAGGLRLLGPVPLVRKMMMVTIVCLFAFLSMFFFDEVNPDTLNGRILNYPPLKFALNEIVIVCIAALGASFYALFEAYKYISKGSYDSKYDSIYWIRFTLGIVSGVILAQFIFIESDSGSSLITQTNESGGFMFSKTLLAFLGGFSARVVHKILNSLVDSIETFISGSARDMLRAREESAKVQLQAKLEAVQKESAAQESVGRIKSTMQLMQLQSQLKNGASSDYVNKKVQEMINSLMEPVNGTGLYEDVTFDDNNNNNFTPPPTNNNYIPPTPPVTPPVTPPMPTDENFDIPNEDSFDIPDFGDMDNPDKPFPGDFDDKGNPPV